MLFSGLFSLSFFYANLSQEKWVFFKTLFIELQDLFRPTSLVDDQERLFGEDDGDRRNQEGEDSDRSSSTYLPEVQNDLGTVRT